MRQWLAANRHNIIVIFVCFSVATGLVFARKLIRSPEKSISTYVIPPHVSGMPNVTDSAVELNTPLKTYSKKIVVKKLKLPQEVLDNTAKEVTATASLKPTVGGYTVASVTDTATGVTDLFVKEKPRSLFCIGGESEIGLLGGVTNHGDSALVFVRQDLIRVGNVHLFAAGGAGVMGGSLGAGVFAGASVKW